MRNEDLGVKNIQAMPTKDDLGTVEIDLMKLYITVLGIINNFPAPSNSKTYGKKL